MRFFLPFLFCTLSVSLFAQQPQRSGNRGAQGTGMMSTGRFYGKVVDAATNKGIDAASVLLIQSRPDSSGKKKDVTIGGQLTTSKGEFSMENLPAMGQFRLTVTAIGYTPVEKTVQFDPRNPDKDLGNIKLEADIQQLGEVTIVATKPMFQMGVDRKIFNVDKNITTTGQTATEIMKNVPGVNVDIDGNVTLRNAAPTIFVDGRPTTLTLDQIPADAIESVEIITNPSAKFDASGGTAGILNVVLKKNRKAGYNGSVRAGIDSRGKINLGGDINVKQGKFNFFLGLNLNQRKSLSEGNTYRENMYSNKLQNTILNQSSNSTNTGHFLFGRIGFDYLMDNRNSFTLSMALPNGQFNSNQTDKIHVDTMSSPVKTQDAIRTTINKRNFKNFGPALGYKHLFPKQGRELTADFNYNTSSNSGSGNYTTQYYNSDGSILGDPALQRLISSGSSTYWTIQSDYTSPIGKGKFESGLRAAVRDNKNINENAAFNYALNQFIVIPSASTNYKYNDQVYAAYSTYSNKLGEKLSYQLGLRAESSQYKGTLISTGETFSNNYPIEFFPSVFITQTLSPGQDLQLNYSRRINRPNFWQQIPYYDVSDLLNISVGNPGLKPEFTNSFELNYSKSLGGGHSLLTSVYFKQTNNLITRYQSRQYDVPLPDGKLDSAMVVSYINANSSRSYGLELTSKNPLAKWADVTTNLNFYNARIDNSGLDKALGVNDRWAFFGKMNFNFKLPANFTIQLSGDYQSRTLVPQGGGGRGGFFGGSNGAAQGYINPNYGVDIALRKEFMKDKKAAITLSANDIFKTRIYDSHSENSVFIQDMWRKRDGRIFRLNFSYRFGKFDVSLFKRKNNRTGSDGGDDMMQ
ncbi:TonB-dependent receptor domain-containing protein [Agriterribacter sp.]|uniref:TonB-dependent receptor domain-containing protein n=1 Tax=Agriterribacter sp. TaxID=2821509 RepID=UPI002BC20748|nr:TonB-dependent receptor [Agriterribacter sp.]HTN08873.1 TonB-dependent receptor [Agriterribacter sp.]